MKSIRLKAENIALLLRGTLKVQNETYISRGDACYTITLADGVEIFARVGGYGNEGRISISGSWPSFLDVEDLRHMITPRDCNAIPYGEAPPSISVSLSKTPEQIALDIARRLLRTLRPMWLKCEAYCQEKVRYDIRRTATVLRIAYATGGKATVNAHGAVVRFESCYGYAEYRGGYTAAEHEKFKLSLDDLSEAQVVAIMALLKAST